VTSAGASVTRANKPPSSGGASGGGAAKVRSTRVDDQGNVVAIMSDGSTKDLNIKSGEFNNRVANLVTQMAKNDYRFSQLPEEEKRAKAVERLTGGTSTPKTGDNSGARPPLSSFAR